MKKRQYPRLQEIIGLLNQHYPSSLAEEWDNVGLQVGDPDAVIQRAAVCLDPTEANLQAALAADAEVLICHHPLLFKPLRRLSPTDAVGRTVWRAVQRNVAIVSIHTNLDRARNGLNDWLAAALGLEQCKPLQGASPGDLLKLVTYVPFDHVEAVMNAAFKAGAGEIGAYDSCSFRQSGTGTFRPGEGTDPYLGRVGELEQAEEVRLETIVPRERLARVLRRLLATHPYEEVAYDLIPLENSRGDIGLGRLGSLPKATTLDEFAAKVKSDLAAEAVRFVGDGTQPVDKVAVCGGSGAFLLHEAKRQGADVLVTGDVKYHEARQAEEIGIALIDAGHFATERLMARQLADTLAEEARQRKWETGFVPLTIEKEPFQTIA